MDNTTLMAATMRSLGPPMLRWLDLLQASKISEGDFEKKVNGMLQQQFANLVARGTNPAQAAVALHATVLVLSQAGFMAEASEQNLPMEILEQRAVSLAANDIAENYDVKPNWAADAIAKLYAERISA